MSNRKKSIVFDKKTKLVLGNVNIILVGMMGAGKTTIGKSLARYTGKQFFQIFLIF